MKIARWITWCLLCMLVGTGCGKKKVPLAPVRGHVFYQNRPLSGGTIVFTPDPQRGGTGPQAWAKVSSDGSFVLVTGAEEGATPGWHRITIAPENSKDLPAHYRDPVQADQLFEVKAGLANICTLRLN